MRYVVRTLAVIAWLSWCGGQALNAEPPVAENPSTARDATHETTPPNADDEPQLQAATAHVRRFEMRDAKGNEIDLIDHSLLRYTDPVRVNSDGSVWAWGKTGRPLAFLELFRNSDAEWWQSFTLTSSERVTLAIPGVGRWQPARADFETHTVPEAPPPDARPLSRTRQLKELARRFSAHEFWDPNNSRFELRLLVQPVHRYHDAPVGIQDGAAFIIAHGTNPEAVLLIEALGESVSESHWHFAIARSSHAELHVEFDRREIWKCERYNDTNNGPTHNYWLVSAPREAPAERRGVR